MNHLDRTWRQLLDKWLDGSYKAADEQALRDLLKKENDAFRREATRGLMGLPAEDHQSRMANIRRRIPQARARRTWPYYYAAAASALLLMAAAIVWRQFQTATPTGTEARSASAEAQNALPYSDDELVMDDQTNATPDPGSALRPAPAPAPAPPPSFADDKPIAFSENRSEGLANPTNETAEIDDARTTPAAEETRETLARSARKTDMALKKENADPLPEASSLSAGAPPASESPSSALPKAKTEQPTGIFPAMESASRIQPAEGWPAFYQRVAAESSCISSANGAALRDTVRLRFTLSEKGFARNVVIVHARYPDCAREAERIVRRQRWIADPPDERREFLISVPFGKN